MPQASHRSGKPLIAGVMSEMKYRYFRDPDNFAYKTDQAKSCSVCGQVGIWFDAGGLYGVMRSSVFVTQLVSRRQVEKN